MLILCIMMMILDHLSFIFVAVAVDGYFTHDVMLWWSNFNVCVCASVLGELNLVVFDESTPLLSLVLKRCEKKFFFLKFQKKTDDDDNHNDEIQFYLPLLFGQKKI